MYNILVNFDTSHLFPFIFCYIFRYRRFGIQHHFQRCNNRWLSSHLCEKHPPQGGCHPRWETEGRRPPGRGERLPSQKFHNSWKLFFLNIFIKYETYFSRSMHHETMHLCFTSTLSHVI